MNIIIWSTFSDRGMMSLKNILFFCCGYQTYNVLCRVNLSLEMLKIRLFFLGRGKVYKLVKVWEMKSLHAPYLSGKMMTPSFSLAQLHFEAVVDDAGDLSVKTVPPLCMTGRFFSLPHQMIWAMQNQITIYIILTQAWNQSWIILHIYLAGSFMGRQSCRCELPSSVFIGADAHGEGQSQRQSLAR